MLVFEPNPKAPEPELIKEIASLLKKGELIAYPTDTLYGLGVDASNGDAIHRIMILKGRDGQKPFPYIIDDPERLTEWGIVVSPLAEAMIERYWPGPVSLIFDGSAKMPRHALDSAGRICLRTPRSQIARSIAAETGGLIVATSANPSGQPAALTALEALKYFRGEIGAIVDGRPCKGHLPSTILDVSEGKVKIMREGAVPAEDILSALAEAQKKLGTQS